MEKDRRKTYQQVAEKDDNGHLANGRNEDGSFVADVVGEVLTRNVSQVPHKINQ